MNTNILRTIILFIAIGIYYPLYAQQGDTLDILRGENGKIRFAHFAVKPHSDRKMDNDTIFLKSILQAKPEDEFRLISEKIDELGITRKRFQQYYKGIKVENAQYLLHGKDGNIEAMNGHYQIDMRVSGGRYQFHRYRI